MRNAVSFHAHHRGAAYQTNKTPYGLSSDQRIKSTHELTSPTAFKRKVTAVADIIRPLMSLTTRTRLV
jgi:hypothetical protein